MKVVINTPGINPNNVKQTRRIELTGQEDITLGRVTFTMTKEALEDLVNLGQATGINVYIVRQP